MKKSMTALASLMLVGLMSVPALAVNCPVGDSNEPMVIAPAPTTGYQQTIQVNGQKTDLSPQAEKVVPFRPQKQTWRRWASLAACLVVVVAAVLAVPQFRGSDNDTTPPQLTGTPFHQVDTLAALSDAVGFPVTEPSALPFDLVNTTYTAYDEGTAEITYTGPDGQTATYRQSLGTADNSGDYNLYPDTQTLPEQNATLKGQDQSYTLALWTDGTYTYSLRLSSGLSADAWQALLDGPAP